MSLMSNIVVYFCLWWVVLFAVLPWGVKVLDSPEKGHAASAPQNPRLLLKFGMTTIIAGLLWALVFLFMQSYMLEQS